MKLQEEVNNNYFNLSLGHNGYEKLKIFYESFLHIFVDNPSYYHFIKEFDAFMYTQSTESLQDYEKSVDLYKVAFEQAYNLSVKDGSVKKCGDVNAFYFATTHALLELCKKLSMKQARVILEDMRFMVQLTAGNMEMLHQNALLLRKLMKCLTY